MFEPRRELDWQLEAKCYGTEHPEWWDADNVVFPHQAEALCRGCPVRRECHLDAMFVRPNSEYAGYPDEWDAELETVGVVRDGRVW